MQTLILGSSAAFKVAVTVAALAILFGGVAFFYGSELIFSLREAIWKSYLNDQRTPHVDLLGDDTYVTLERTPCFGTCPVYGVRVFGSGRVTFRGRYFVCEKSPPDYFVDRAAVARLVAGLNASGFTSMTDYVSYDATDNPTALIELSTSAGHHIVEHYHGDDSAPRLLTWMEDRIDEVAGTDKWLGKRVGNERVCQLPDGTTRPLSWD